MKRRHGKVYSGHTIPYGSLVDASPELRDAYYQNGYKNDDSFPELPICYPEEVCTCPEEALFKKELAARMVEAVDSLYSPRSSKVLKLIYGINCNEHTTTEIANMFDLSSARIPQIEAKALRQLSHPKKNLRELFDFDEYETTEEKRKNILREQERIKKHIEKSRLEQKQRVSERFVIKPWVPDFKKEKND